MGCVSSKQFHGGNLHAQGKHGRRPSTNSLRRLVSYNSSKRREEKEEAAAAGEPGQDAVVVTSTASNAARDIRKDPGTARFIPKPPEPALPDDGEKKAATAAAIAVGVVVDRVDRETVTAAPEHQMHAPVDATGANGVLAEHGLRSGGGRSEGESKLRVVDVPNGVDREHVAAGWLPRKAEGLLGWLPGACLPGRESS